MLPASAASAGKLQLGVNMDIGENKVRAANLNLLNGNELEGLPTKNLKTERDLSRFDCEARLQRAGTEDSR